MNDAIVLSGPEAGPTSMVMVGVHGNEVCGIAALQELLPKIEVRKGRVIFAYGNPKAIERSVRLTEKNLNRMFKDSALLSDDEKSSYEYGRSRFLISYLDEADMLLDIHASHTPESKPFIICEPNGFVVANQLPFDLVVSGFDALEPGGTDSYMNSHGKVGICAECGYLGDPSSTDTAKKTILAFLNLRGHIDGDAAKPMAQEYIHMDSIYITKTDDFRLEKEFRDFEEIRVGEVIGRDRGEPVTAAADSIVLFARNRKALGEEAFLLGQRKGSE